jgi:hypothetical protein
VTGLNVADESSVSFDRQVDGDDPSIRADGRVEMLRRDADGLKVGVAPKKPGQNTIVARGAGMRSHESLPTFAPP